VLSVVLALTTVPLTGSPAWAGPQDDPPPVTVNANNAITPSGTSAATITLDAAGTSGGMLEPGQEQRVIEAAAAAAGVSDASSSGGRSDASDGASVAGSAPVLTECSWRAAELPADAVEWQGNDPAAGQLVINPCNGASTYAYVPNAALGIGAAAAAAPPPPPDPAVLAAQGSAELVPPDPVVRRSPGEDYTDPARGVPVTWVGLYTWFWVDRGDWVPLTRTVELRGVSATVTATPMSASVEPGDGSAPSVCDGPGRAWTAADANLDPASVGGCGHMYERVTAGAGIRATTKINYAVSWTSNTGAGGVLPDLAGSSTSAPFLVEQIRVVIDR
jgi:hypothetical protein